MGVDAWVQFWEAAEWTDELLAAFLRLAYGRGYLDALTEPERGKLCRDHGLAVQTRKGWLGEVQRRSPILAPPLRLGEANLRSLQPSPTGG
jgi:hypothetical protein